MSYAPVSREEMRSLKAKNDERIKNMQIDTIVSMIYSAAVSYATTKSDCIFRWPYSNQQTFGYVSGHHITSVHHITYQVLLDNMEEILKRLQGLFPDSLVETKKVSMARGRDGKDYDISTLDEELLSFVDIRGRITSENIVIDWS
jgi:hypothetical protein